MNKKDLSSNIQITKKKINQLLIIIINIKYSLFDKEKKQKVVPKSIDKGIYVDFP